MKLLKVKHFRQTPGLCGPYSLKILFSFFGKDVGIKKLVQLTKATKKYGAEHWNMKTAASKLGAKVYTKANATLKDIEHWVNKKHLPVMVCWFSEDCDHYSVVIGVDKKYVYLCNPELDKPVEKIKKYFFNSVWFGFPGKNCDSVLWRWMMVTTKI